jgi:hypothetical protein
MVLDEKQIKDLRDSNFVGHPPVFFSNPEKMRALCDMALAYAWMREQISDDMQWYLLGRTVNSPEEFDIAVSAAMRATDAKSGTESKTT